MDEAISHYIRSAYQLAIGSRTAERIKIEIGSAVPMPEEQILEVRGRHLITGLPTAVQLTSEEVRAAISAPVREIMQIASSAIGMDRQRPPDVGRGLALVEFSTSPGVYSGIMTVHATGNVTLQTPIIENGSGAHTVFRQIVAEEFDVPVDQVTVVASIENIEQDRGVGGSRTTRLVGKLAISLARRLQTRLANVLAGEFGRRAAGLQRGQLGLVRAQLRFGG